MLRRPPVHGGFISVCDKDIPGSGVFLSLCGRVRIHVSHFLDGGGVYERRKKKVCAQYYPFCIVYDYLIYATLTNHGHGSGDFPKLE